LPGFNFQKIGGRMTLIENIRGNYPNLTEAQADRVRDLIEYQLNVDSGVNMSARYTELVASYQNYRQNGYSNIAAAVKAVSEQAEGDLEPIDPTYKPINPTTSRTGNTNWIKIAIIVFAVWFFFVRR